MPTSKCKCELCEKEIDFENGKENSKYCQCVFAEMIEYVSFLISGSRQSMSRFENDLPKLVMDLEQKYNLKFTHKNYGWEV